MIATYPASEVKRISGFGRLRYAGGHTDFWTGEITPEIRTQYALDGSGRVERVYELPKDWRNYRVIPLPVGLVVGSLLTLAVITVVSRRPGKAQPDSAVPAV